jgi:LuxR family maltose regulon positive regulatory protein
MDALDALVMLANDPAYISIAGSLRARMALMQGDLESALRFARGIDAEIDMGVMLWWVEVPRITEARVLIAQGSGESLKAGLRMLRQYEQENRDAHNDLQLVTILLLKSIAYFRLAKRSKATSLLKRTIAAAAPGNVLQPFLDLDLEIDQELKKLSGTETNMDFVQRVREARWERRSRLPVDEAATTKSVASSRDGGPKGVTLTKREMEALELLGRGMLIREISEELFISYETARTHVRNIYQKLDADNRHEAVEKARAVGLLSKSPSVK